MSSAAIYTEDKQNYLTINLALYVSTLIFVKWSLKIHTSQTGHKFRTEKGLI